MKSFDSGEITTKLPGVRIVLQKESHEIILFLSFVAKDSYNPEVDKLLHR